jgi:hypothetical protein
MPGTVCDLMTSEANDTALFSDELAGTLARNGFATLDSITSLEEVAEIRTILSTLIANNVGAKEGARFDTLSTSPDEEHERSIQITNPSEFAPELWKTRYVQNATQLARKLLSPDCVLMVDFALMKPAHVGAGTPWHQDEAYRDPAFIHTELTFWMPLQDVGIDDGCMVFIPHRQNLGVLDHKSLHDDPRSHAFECSVQIPEEEAVACPLPAGGCTIHNQVTLHCTRDNTSSVDRYAYILIFTIPPKPAPETSSFPWLEGRQNLDRQAKRAWLLRGGVFVLLMRKWRRGDLRGMAMLRYSFAKGIKLLRGR